MTCCPAAYSWQAAGCSSCLSCAGSSSRAEAAVSCRSPVLRHIAGIGTMDRIQPASQTLGFSCISTVFYSGILIKAYFTSPNLQFFPQTSKTSPKTSQKRFKRAPNISPKHAPKLRLSKRSCRNSVKHEEIKHHFCICFRVWVKDLDIFRAQIQIICTKAYILQAGQVWGDNNLVNIPVERSVFRFF